ncbi:MAG: hypothetical protein GXX85_15510 [Ignavibacteria bacterium]|nr:hypothetical protein [Ignavibacteria bacterium]
MKLSFFQIFVLLFSGFLAAQQNTTNGSYNGNAWNKMFLQSKMNYLNSMIEKRIFYEKIGEKLPETDTEKILQKIASGEIIIDVTLHQIVKYLDSFYRNRKNLPVPITDAYCTIVKDISQYNIPLRKESEDSLRAVFPGDN